MQLGKLDHVNVRTAQLETMVAWYENVLGMRSGYRPNFPFPGAWLYTGDDPVVHLIGVADPSGAGSESALKLEHFAFSATGRAAFETRLEDLGEAFRISEVPDVGITQYNIWDPDGNHIHIDFRDEA